MVPGAVESQDSLVSNTGHEECMVRPMDVWMVDREE